MLASFAVSMLIYYQDALLARSSALFEQEPQLALIDLLRSPPGLRKEPLQALSLPSLRSGDGLGVCEAANVLVALGRKQQSLQVATEAFALDASAEEIVEADSVRLQRAGGQSHGQPSSHGDTSLWRRWSTTVFLLQQTTARHTRVVG
jgi:hypothetical protein